MDRPRGRLPLGGTNVIENVTHRYAHFDDVFERLPSEAKCVSCAGRPPPHVRCPRGWDYGWCARHKVVKTEREKCAPYYGEVRWPRACGFCVFSAGFTPGVQLVEPKRWKGLRSALVFVDAHAPPSGRRPRSGAPRRRRDTSSDAPPRRTFPRGTRRYERGAAAVAARLVSRLRPETRPRDYVALHLRRGDKSHTLDKHGLTVDAVLDRAARLADGRPVVVATDDRSDATAAAIQRRGFAMADSAALARDAPGATDALGAYRGGVESSVSARRSPFRPIVTDGGRRSLHRTMGVVPFKAPTKPASADCYGRRALFSSPDDGRRSLHRTDGRY